jgi:hypothetical protein
MATIKDFFQRFVTKKPEVSIKKEDFASGQDFLKALQSGNVRGFKNKFVSDIYKERILYPHEEMNIAKKAFRYNSYVNSSVRTRANFMTGGRFTIYSDDENYSKQLNKLIQSTKLDEYSQFMGIDLVDVGNFYAERIYSGGKIINYQYIAHPERIYIDLDEKGFVKGFFQEIPEQMSDIKFKSIKYYGDRRKSIKGIDIPKEKLFHLKIGVSEIPAYGRGFVCCVINDVEILLEIERAIAVIARYKAIPKKLISLNRGEDPSGGGKAAEWYANQLNNLADDEIAVLPELINQTDLSYSGKDVNFEPIVNYLKKKITVALAPSFIMHGEETNYAVSRDQKEAFILQVNAEREYISEQLKREIIILAKSHNFPVKDFEIQFGEFDLGQTEDKINYARNSFTANLLTLNEAREILGYPIDKELGEMYFNEMVSNANLFGLGNDKQTDETGEEISSNSKDT